MEPHFRIEPNGSAQPIFPSLPIVTPDPPERRPERAKYGGLFYFGIAGLVAVISLVVWFGYGVWSLRDVWARIYVLHDAGRSETERVRAAFALSRDPRVSEDQRWEMSLRRPLPTTARYILAESLKSELAARDPSAYANAVGKSPDWPDWLRLVLARPLAYAAIQGTTFPREPVQALAAHADPAIGLWATFVLASSRPADGTAVQKLKQSCETAGPNQELACLLWQAHKLTGRPAEQAKALDQATVWLRSYHPAVEPLWKDWRVERGQLAPKAG